MVTSLNRAFNKVVIISQPPNSAGKRLGCSSFYINNAPLSRLVNPDLKANEEFALSRKPKEDIFEWTAKIFERDEQGQIKRNKETGKKITRLKVKIRQLGGNLEETVNAINAKITGALGKKALNNQEITSKQMIPEEIRQSVKNAKPGDVVIYRSDKGYFPNHVGLIGDEEGHIFHSTKFKGTYLSPQTLEELAKNAKLKLALFPLNKEARSKLDEDKFRELRNKLLELPFNEERLNQIVDKGFAIVPTAKKLTNPDYYRIEEKDINRLDKITCAQTVLEPLQELGIIPKELKTSRMLPLDIPALEDILERPLYLHSKPVPMMYPQPWNDYYKGKPYVGSAKIPTQEQINELVAKRKQKVQESTNNTPK